MRASTLAGLTVVGQLRAEDAEELARELATTDEAIAWTIDRLKSWGAYGLKLRGEARARELQNRLPADAYLSPTDDPAARLWRDVWSLRSKRKSIRLEYESLIAAA